MITKSVIMFRLLLLSVRVPLHRIRVRGGQRLQCCLFHQVWGADIVDTAPHEINHAVEALTQFEVTQYLHIYLLTNC